MFPATEDELKPHYCRYSAKEAYNRKEEAEIRNLRMGDNVQVHPLKPNSREWLEAEVNKQVSGWFYEEETGHERMQDNVQVQPLKPNSVGRS